MSQSREKRWTPRKADVQHHYIVGRGTYVNTPTEVLKQQFQRFLDKIEQAAYKRGFEEAWASSRALN